MFQVLQMYLAPEGPPPHLHRNAQVPMLGNWPKPVLGLRGQGPDSTIDLLVRSAPRWEQVQVNLHLDAQIPEGFPEFLAHLIFLHRSASTRNLCPDHEFL